MKFFEKEKQEQKKEVEARGILLDLITAPVTGIAVSIATTLLMLGFSGGQAIIEYNQKLDMAHKELAALKFELLQLQQQNEQFHSGIYSKQEVEERLKYLVERIKALEERIIRLERKYFN